MLLDFFLNSFFNIFETGPFLVLVFLGHCSSRSNPDRVRLYLL
jgi:hypothetical protein